MVLMVFEHSDLAPSLRLGAVLRDYGHRLRVIRPDLDEPLPPDLDDVEGVVTCGGPQSANDSHDWIRDELAFIHAAHAAQLPIVGLCLGSQLLAKALGGAVGPAEGGIELGWHDVALTDVGREDIIHTGVAWHAPMFHWHREQVTKLPPGSRTLAGSARCHVQAWSLGLRTYAFQHHPEVDLPTIERWINDEPRDLEEAGITPNELRGQTAALYPAFERLTRRLFESIALFLMPVDRRYRGLVPDMLH